MDLKKLIEDEKKREALRASGYSETWKRVDGDMTSSFLFESDIVNVICERHLLEATLRREHGSPKTNIVD